MEWLKYLLQVSVCITLFLCLYLLFLSKLTFFKFNRFYLLSTLIISFIIPALHVNMQRELKTVPAETLIDRTESERNLAEPLRFNQPIDPLYNHDSKPTIDWFGFLPHVYGLIAGIIIAIQLSSLFNILKFTGSYIRSEDGLKLVTKSTGFTNCSFFNYVFIDQESLSDSELSVFLQHEKVHAAQFHSVDKVLLMLFKAVLWFNPIIYLYDRALEQVNEYVADETTSASVGNHAYAHILLKLAITRNDMPLVLNFVKNPLKDRIQMLFNAKSKSMKKLVYLFALPAVGGLFLLFAVEVVYAENKTALKGEKKVMEQQSQVFKEAKPSRSRQKEVEIIVIKEDSVSKKRTPAIPRMISYQKMTGDSKQQIYYLETAEIEVNGGILNAESVEYDRLQHIIIAKKASFEKDGTIETGDQITFDLIKNTHSVQSLAKKITNTVETDMNVRYQADSAKYSKNKNIIYLFGNAKVSYGQTTISGSKIIYNNLNQVLTAEQAELSSTTQKAVKADSIFYDLKTGRFKLYGTDLK